MFLTLEDLVPNALIELIENGNSRIISYPSVLQYGCCVIQELRKNKNDALLFIHKDKTREFEEEYKDVFEFFEMNDIGYIKLRENISTNYLRKHFRIQQSLATLIAMTNDNSKQALGINNENNKILLRKHNRKLYKH